MIAALRAGIESAERKAAGILVLDGAGRAFCAGADLKERRALDDAGKLANNRSIAATADALAEAPMPTLPVLSGLALGGGCELALACAQLGRASLTEGECQSVSISVVAS